MPLAGRLNVRVVPFLENLRGLALVGVAMHLRAGRRLGAEPPMPLRREPAEPQSVRSGLVGRSRYVRPAWANAQALPPTLAAAPARFGRHPHWRESGAIQISAPFAGFLSVGHFAAHERKFSRHFKRIF